jgi:oligopeptide/dipeptide ABC transporter ATP-binding protein
MGFRRTDEVVELELERDGGIDPGGPLLEVRDLRVVFPSDDGDVVAVDGLSFEVQPNETLGIVGESGSGKSVTSLSVLGLLTKRAKVSGSIKYRGRELLGLKERELRVLRGRHLAMVFQDALAALNPVFTVGSQIAEAVKVHDRRVSDADLKDRVVGLLELVGIPNPRERADQYPHEYSGGMRQRAMIAMSIANDPDLLIADEPTTALDVTIQAQVLEVMERIQDRTESAIMLITHDLGVVAGVADRVMVMYAGRQAETGTVEEIFYEPRHPYTQGLLASLPRLDRRSSDRLHRIVGQPPSLIHVPPGCAFHPRCPYARVPGRCNEEEPALHDLGSTHVSACHFAEELTWGEAAEEMFPTDAAAAEVELDLEPSADGGPRGGDGSPSEEVAGP